MNLGRLAAFSLGWWLSACGHAPPEPDTPGAFSTVEYEPVAAVPSPAACPRCPTPAPARECPTPVEAKAPTCSDITDPRAVPEGVRGWYCYEIRRKRGDKDVLSHCRRSKEMCEHSRKDAVKLKAHITKCEYRDKASCFQMEDLRERELYLWCYTDSMQCLSQWGDYRERKDEYLRVTRCQEDIE